MGKIGTVPFSGGWKAQQYRTAPFIPLQIPPEEIPDCQVKMTVVGGKVVYDGR